MNEKIGIDRVLYFLDVLWKMKSFDSLLVLINPRRD